MSSFSDRPHEQSPQVDPEQAFRDDVLKTGGALIDLVEKRGPFQFDRLWTAKPLTDENGLPIDGAVFECDELEKADRFDQAEISRHEIGRLSVKWTRIRPNENS